MNFPFHLTFDELKRRYRHYAKPPKLHRSDYMPYALTDRAFSLLSMRLHSPIAVKMRLYIYHTVSERIQLSELLKKFKESMRN